ncbi:MAG: hypothetical protein HW379_1334 [Actinobacteria bacterium]|nr:hypothetical protein [Actinomycetota bacterium]
MAEAEDLKSSQCGFDPHSGHQFSGAFKQIELNSFRVGIFLALNLLSKTTARTSGCIPKGEKSYAQFKPCFRTGV